jgi:hypothetical protein
MRLPQCLVAMTAAISFVAMPATAATPRELLTTAAFQTADKKTALTLVNAAITNSEAVLAGNPGDHEAQLGRAMGIGYRARLTRKPADAKMSRKLFEGLVAANPRDAEAQLFLGGWHLDAVAAGFLATTVLGAKREEGLDHLNRSVALGGNRAFFKGIAAMMRIRLDPADIRNARVLAEQAVAAPAPTVLDRIVKRESEAMLVPLRNNDGKAAAALARKLLPFGRIE